MPVFRVGGSVSHAVNKDKDDRYEENGGVYGDNGDRYEETGDGYEDNGYRYSDNGYEYGGNSNRYKDNGDRYGERVHQHSEVLDSQHQHACVEGQHKINLDLQVIYEDFCMLDVSKHYSCA